MRIKSSISNANLLFQFLQMQPSPKQKQEAMFDLYARLNANRMLKRVRNAERNESSVATAELSNDDILEFIGDHDETFTFNGTEYVMYTFVANNRLVVRTLENIVADDDCNILVVGAGGSGASADDNQSNGGGGGGGISVGQLITVGNFEMHIDVGVGGAQSRSKTNGNAGEESIVEIFQTVSTGDGVGVGIIAADGGQGGTTSSRGFGGNSVAYVSNNVTFSKLLLYQGGSGGDEDDGNAPIILTATATAETFPLFAEQYAAGGGGSKQEPPNDSGYHGGLGGGNQRITSDSGTTDKNAVNGFIGGIKGYRIADGGGSKTSEVENGSLDSAGNVVFNGVFGGSGLFAGCGGGAGGCSLYRPDGTGEPVVGTSFSSGVGANGLVQICIKKSSAHKLTVGNKTEKGTTTDSYYWIFQTNNASKFKTLKQLNSFSCVLVSGGGGGGGSGYGVSNGGGGGGTVLSCVMPTTPSQQTISFLTGLGGLGGDGGYNNATDGEISKFKNETTLQYVECYGGKAGTTTAAGSGGNAFTITDANVVVVAKYAGGSGGDQSNGNDGLSSSANLFASDAELSAAIASYSIPTTYAGGGGGSKQNPDDADYSGGIGAIDNIGGLRGQKNNYSSTGFPGQHGGGGGAGGYAKDGDRLRGGDGGNGIIVMWVKKTDVV